MSAPAIKAFPAPFRTIPLIELSEFAFSKHSFNPTLTPLLKGFTGGLSTSRIAIFPFTE